MMNFSVIPKRFLSCGTSKNLLYAFKLSNYDLRNVRSLSLCCSKKIIPHLHYNLLVQNRCNNFCSKENTMVANSDNEKSSFMKMLDFRKKQAQSSVLLELHGKEDIAFAVSACEKFGGIKQAYSYSGVSENIFLLLEFEDEASVHRLLHNAHYKNILDAFPVLSRIVGYVKKNEQDKFTTSVSVLEDIPNIQPLKEGTVSDLIENIYMTEKLSELNIRLRFFFCCILREVLSGAFPFCDAIPFGSSVNGIGRHGCDLDLMIRLYPEKVDCSSELYFINKTCVGDIQNLQRRVVHCLGDLMRTFLPGITTVQKILHARVPIIKLEHKILGMQIDISINNMAPILMAELLHFWGEVDSRIRPLVYAVKKWAKETNVTYDTPGSWITNFSLSLLVIFFLQNRPNPILPSMNESIYIKGAQCSEEYKLEYLLPLSELQTKASQNKESLALLLKEFLGFIGSHPFKNKLISLLDGKATEKESELPLWIQYPLEENLNVSKNVSPYELWDMCEKARVSAQYLNSNLNVKGAGSKDLSVLLGIPNIRKLDINKAKRIDVSSLLGYAVRNQNKAIGRRRVGLK